MSKMISMTEDGMFMASENINVTDYINITLACQMNMFNNMLQNVPEESVTEVKEHLFDLYNRSASAFLEAFAPEIDMRPDLTVEAILKAENDLIDEAVNKLEEAGE